MVMPLSRSASRTGRKLSPGTQNTCWTPLITSCSTSAAAAVRLFEGLCIGGLSFVAAVSLKCGSSSRAVQHQFGVGQIGKARAARALEIFAATRLGIDADQAGHRPIRIQYH